MIIRTTRRTMTAALAAVSSIHGDNIRWRRMDDMSGRHSTDPVDDDTVTRWRATITVHDTGGPGGSMDPISGRRISGACWHCHGQLFDIIMSMDPAATIRTSSTTVRMDDGGTVRGNWIDYPRGSMVYPSRASEWCNCDGRTLSGQVWKDDRR